MQKVSAPCNVFRNLKTQLQNLAKSTNSLSCLGGGEYSLFAFIYALGAS